VSRSSPPTGRGSPLVAARVALDLLLDLASTPFHVAAFVLTRRRHKERFARMLAESRSTRLADDGEPGGEAGAGDGSPASDAAS